MGRPRRGHEGEGDGDEPADHPVVVPQWTGREATALRRAMRLTIEGFADHLGVSRRAVDKWQALLEATIPRPDVQAALDTALQRASIDCQERFRAVLRSATRLPRPSPRPVDRSPPGLPAPRADARDTLPATEALDAERPPLGDEATPLPSRLGAADLQHVEQLTAGLRALDYQFGGGSCRDAAIAQVTRTRRLLEVDTTDELRRRLLVALADLHNLAGWTSTDLGLDDSGQWHLAEAVRHSRQAGEPWLVADSLYRTGRLHLHRGRVTEALRLFRLGQTIAHRSVDPVPSAVLLANEAWSLAQLGDAQRSLAALSRAEDQLARADPALSRGRGQVFDETDLLAMRGVTHLALATYHEDQLASAREALQRTVDARPARMARSRAFELTALAVACLSGGDETAGLQWGRRAVLAAADVRSQRVVDRLTPLYEAASVASSTEATDLVEEIAVLRGAAHR